MFKQIKNKELCGIGANIALMIKTNKLHKVNKKLICNLQFPAGSFVVLHRCSPRQMVHKKSIFKTFNQKQTFE